MNIQKVTDPSFGKYGKIICSTRWSTTGLLRSMWAVRMLSY